MRLSGQSTTLHKTVAEAGQRAEVARLEAERAQLDRRIAELRSTL